MLDKTRLGAGVIHRSLKAVGETYRSNQYYVAVSHPVADKVVLMPPTPIWMPTAARPMPSCCPWGQLFVQQAHQGLRPGGHGTQTMPMWATASLGARLQPPRPAWARARWA